MGNIGRYRVIGEIGHGSNAIVHRAVDPESHRTVAIKVFASKLDADESTPLVLTADLNILRQLDHPGIAKILDVGVSAHQPFVVTEFVDGSRLDHGELRSALNLREKLELAITLSEALSVAHELPLLHGNLKPSNILVTAELVPKLLDFELIRMGRTVVSDAATRALDSSAYYRSPEQIYGQRPDVRTDIFCLGVALYELFFNRRPFDGNSWIQIARKILHDEPPSTGGVCDLPEDLMHLLIRALARNPLDRFQSMRELVRSLDKIRQSFNQITTTGAQAVGDAPAPEHEDPRAYLVVQEGERQRIVPLVASELTIGRKGENDLALIEEHISRHHCVITRDEDRFFIEDRKSKHGTFRNGERVTKTRLRDGDRLEFGRGGRFRLTFHSGEARSRQVTTGSSPLARSDVELLLDVTFALNASLSVDAVLNIIMDSALTLTAAERGFIMLQDQDGSFNTRICRHIHPTGNSTDDQAYSHTAVQRCLATQQPLVIHDMKESADFAERNSVVDLNLQSILCLPLIFDSAVLGVLYLDSRELSTPFRSAQLDLLMAFASSAAVSLENARLYELATVDRLTGVFLRHHFETRLATEFRRAQRYNSPLSLIFIDVDDFKVVNDNYGHLVGDRILRAIAQKIKDASRNTDIVAKYGGDEFVVIAPESSNEMAEVVAERLRDDVHKLRQELIAGHTVTISVGVATYPGNGIETAADLVRIADDALLLAKRTGRNRVVTGGTANDREGTHP